MKFSMWVSLALVGVGVLFARDGSANGTPIDGGLGRRRIERAGSVNSSTLEQRMRDISNNNSVPKRQPAENIITPEQDEADSQTRSLFKLEEDWFRTILLSSAIGSFSMMPLPTVAPNQETEPTLAPTIRPATDLPTEVPPTNMPTKRPTVLPETNPPTTRKPTDSPTPEPTPDPTLGPTPKPSSGMPTTESPTEAPTGGPTTEAPTTTVPTESPSGPPTTESPTPVPTTSEPTRVPTSSPTKRPTPNPTDATVVTPRPTKAPTRPPTAAPTRTPTFEPTISPTEGPTEAPSLTPTTADPTFEPTAAPTASVPTAAPTPACEVEVEISCVWAVDNKTDCRNIPIPGACSAYDIDLSDVLRPVPLSEITMLFDYSGCASSLTLQDKPEEFSCIDQGQPSTTGTALTAQVACFDEEMNVLVDGTIRPGEFILLQGQNENGDLGEVIRCEISEDGPDGLAMLQEMSITTSVLGNFHLSDRYGSFVVESCDALRCEEPVLYSYNITNTQSVPKRITELLRVRGDDLVSLLPLLSEDQLNQEPGERTVITEEASLNVCFDAQVNTTILAQSSTQDETNCRGSDDYSIVVEVECRIDVDIVCMTDTGEPCSTIEVSAGTCSDDGVPIQSLRLRYENSTCEASDNSQGESASCDDFSSQMDRVQVTCTGLDGTDVIVTADSGDEDIGGGETMLLTSPSSGGLPSAISCEVRSSRDPDIQYQEVFFVTSGSLIDLNLRDQFGSLLVEACSTESKSLDCQTTVCLEYFVQNVGTHDVDVIDLTRAVGEDTAQLLGLLPNTELAIGETSEAVEKLAVDTCKIEKTCVSSIVQSSGSNGLVCEDLDEVCFGGVDCKIDVEMTCQPVDDGFSGNCTDLQGERFPQCVCSECPSALIFRYTASPCPESAVPGLLSCLDENPLPEEDAFVIVYSMEDDSELFRGSVDSGEQIMIAQDGSCFPAELMIIVSVEEEAEASSQVVTIDTSCSESGIMLLEMFGSAQLSGYTCAEDDIPHNCFVNAEFEVVASNIGPVEQTLTTLTFIFGDESSDLLDNIPVRRRDMDPSESITTTASAVLERCVANTQIASSIAQGNDGECEASTDILIGPIEPGTRTPTTSPVETDAPTPESPTGSPSSTTEPGTPSPTQAPTVPDTPTQAPSISPSGACVLDIQTVCTPPPGSDSCEEIRAEPVLCESRPETMTLLYEGGDCENSFNAQAGPLFKCFDYNGGPPTEAGEPTYVVITDIRGAGIVFFHGWADVGDVIPVVNPEGGFVEADQNITIYSSNETNPESIIQTVTYHSSCSDNPSAQALFLKDRFGAMEVVGFTNVDQGEQSCFTSAEIEASVVVPTSVGGQPITLTSLVTTFNSIPGDEDGLANFTSEVAGEQITSESEPLDVSLTLDLDLTRRRTYNVFTTVEGTTSDGRECRGSDLLQFAAGQPPPPLFPTLAPTQPPTHSQQPSPDPETTPCQLTAVIQCIVKKGGSNTCLGLQHPSEVTCTGFMSPSSLSFQYTGDRCPVNPQNYRCADTDLNLAGVREAVFVEIKDGERVVAFGDVGLNQFIELEGDYGAESLITLYTSVNGLKGDPLQVLNIPTECDPDDDLTLLNQYGALELTGFTNAASGEQGIQAQIELVYAVENSGFQPATVDSAQIIDAFDGGPIELIDDPLNLEAGQLSLLYRNEQILNLRLKEQVSRIDTFFLAVRGSSVANDLECTDSAQLSF